MLDCIVVHARCVDVDVILNKSAWPTSDLRSRQTDMHIVRDAAE